MKPCRGLLLVSPVNLNNPLAPMNSHTNFVIWNCRGSNNSDFRRNFGFMLDYHKPCLVALLETKMENHQTLRDDFLFTDMIEVPANGRSGGIVFLWSSRLITVDRITVTSQEIHAMVKVYSSTQPWLFSVIYASNLFNCRKILWDNLIALRETYNGPWLIGGDFNEVLTANDKWGGRHVNNNRADIFWSCINNCNLFDLGFKGSKYTWSNKRTRNDLILERLDR